MGKLIFPMLMTAFMAHAYAGVFNLVEPRAVWSKKEIQVCFADKTQLEKSDIIDDIEEIKQSAILAFGDDQRRAVRRTIRREFTSEKTGIRFFGWKNCEDTPESDAYIYLINDKNQDFIGHASLGESSYGVSVSNGLFRRRKELVIKRSHPKKAYVALNIAQVSSKSLTSTEVLRIAALHEFGHLAGLTHEHDDVNEKGKRYPDLNCKSAKYTPDERPTDSAVKFSVYDRNSVMNYCYINLLTLTGLSFQVLSNVKDKFNFDDPSLFEATELPEGTNYEIKIKLSQGDVHALKCLYVYDSATKAAICKSTYDPKGAL